MNLSASQISLWNTCHRRWAFNYAGENPQREPAALSARAGTRTHELVEKSFLTEEPVDRTKVYALNFPIGEAAHALSERAREQLLGESGLRIEQPATADIEGVTFKLVTDVLTDKTVLDHKTTKSARYMKTAEKLENDPQRLIYTHVYQDRERAIWNSYIWTEGAVRSVELPIVPEYEKVRLHVLQPAYEILEAGKDVDPMSLPPTPESCKLYPPDGCQFYSRCYPSEEKKQMSSLLEKLRAKSGTEVAAVATASEERQTTFQFDETSTKAPPIEAPAYPEPEPTVEYAQPPVRQEAEPTGIVEPVGSLIEWLFVDCIPMDFPVMNLDRIISEANTFVATEQDLPNALLMKFAGGAPMVASVVEKELQRTGGTQYAYLSTKSSEGKEVYVVLSKHAKHIVKGMI